MKLLLWIFFISCCLLHHLETTWRLILLKCEVFLSQLKGKIRNYNFLNWNEIFSLHKNVNMCNFKTQSSTCSRHSHSPDSVFIMWVKKEVSLCNWNSLCWYICTRVTSLNPSIGPACCETFCNISCWNELFSNKSYFDKFMGKLWVGAVLSSTLQP